MRRRVLLFIQTLIGNGLGPSVTGFISDWLAPSYQHGLASLRAGHRRRRQLLGGGALPAGRAESAAGSGADREARERLARTRTQNHSSQEALGFSGLSDTAEMLNSRREKAMLDGRNGKARQKAMELLVRYAEALGAERFVDTQQRRGRAGLGQSVSAELLQGQGRRRRLDAIFSYFDLDSDELVEVPQALVHDLSPAGRRRSASTGRRSARRSRCSGTTRSAKPSPRDHGVEILKTCTPYLAGNVPANGEHCAWMESSAVDLRQLGARRAHQHRGTREHERGDADRQDSRLGTASDRVPLRHAPHRRATCRSSRSWTGACSATSSATSCRSTFPSSSERSAGPRSFGSSTSAPRRPRPAASRCITSSASRRRPSTLEMAFGPNRPVETIHLRRSRAPAGLRSPQRQRAAIRTSTT